MRPFHRHCQLRCVRTQNLRAELLRAAHADPQDIAPAAFLDRLHGRPADHASIRHQKVTRSNELGGVNNSRWLPDPLINPVDMFNFLLVAWNTVMQGTRNLQHKTLNSKTFLITYLPHP